jgi:phage-related protein (TIGR01555 family)
MSDTLSRFRADGYANAVSGLGSMLDKSSYNFYLPKPRLTPETLDALYTGEAMAARIIDRVVDDGTREDITITGEDEAFDFASVQSQLEDLDAVNHVGEAWRWSRLYGGSLLFMNIEDGQKMSEPLDLANARKLVSLRAIDSTVVMPEGEKSGMGSRGFLMPEWYRVMPGVAGGDGGDDRIIHRSRVIRFDGVKVPARVAIRNGGWGPSILDRVGTEVMRLGTVMGYLSNIMHDVSVQVYTMEGLRDAICGRDQSMSEEDMKQMFQTIKQTMDNLHMLVLDNKDEYKEVSRSVTGLSELADKFIDSLVRATDMPRTVLLGEQPSGLNASGDSEVRSWFDFVKSQQRTVLTPALTKLLNVVFAIRGNNGEDVPDEWTIDYAPLWQPSEAETAATQLQQAQTDELYMLNSVYTAEETRERLVSEGRIPESTEGEGGDREPAGLSQAELANVRAMMEPGANGGEA